MTGQDRPLEGAWGMTALIFVFMLINFADKVVVGLAAGSAGYAVAQNATGTSDYNSGTETGVRPTGVGLPDIGESGTAGASDFATNLRAYHDSGAYDKDLAAVGGAAKAYLDQRLAANTARSSTCAASASPAARHCLMCSGRTGTSADRA